MSAEIKKSPPVRPSGRARLKMKVSFFIGLSQGLLDGPAGGAFFRVDAAFRDGGYFALAGGFPMPRMNDPI